MLPANIPYEEIYTEEELKVHEQEFEHVKESHYLDHGGSNLYCKSQIKAYSTLLQKDLFSNPHSRNPSSSITTDSIDHIRHRLLDFFGASSREYSIIFTSGATAALKLLAESFVFNDGPFVYCEEVHTSVFGMREIVKTPNICCISSEIMRKTLEKQLPLIEKNCKSPTTPTTTGRKRSLVCYGAQCNFSGFKYPLEWIDKIRTSGLHSLISSNSSHFSYSKNYYSSSSPLNDESQHDIDWYVMLDAASYAATNPLNLNLHKPDFVPVSFYKIFGFPTGLGALLVRKEIGDEVLGGKKYFGGGTVNLAIPSQLFHVKRNELHERFEDGTISFLSILALGPALDSLFKFGRNLETISTRTFRLAQYFYKNLLSLRYENGQPVAKIYSDTEFNEEKTQGPVVTFNLLRHDGTFIGYSQMEQMAYLHNVILRYGCFCNPGACSRHLGHDSSDTLKFYKEGHLCGDMLDVIDGSPTGGIRVSIGYMTRKKNLDFLLSLIHNCWIHNFSSHISPQIKTRPDLLAALPDEKRRLLRIFIYPIKSCAPFEVKQWGIGTSGLVYDREWLIVNSMGVSLSLKREPDLVFIIPTIVTSNRSLTLSHPYFDDVVRVPLEVPNSDNCENVKICNSKVCGDLVSGVDCGDEVSEWLCKVLNRTGLRLIRKLRNNGRKLNSQGREVSFVNESQFLLISMGSLHKLNRDLSEKQTLLNNNQNNYSSSSTQPLHLYEDENEEVENLLQRFRPNFVINEIEPYAEEDCDGIQIGNLELENGGPCRRCATICYDPKTGKKSTEPLLTLSKLQKHESLGPTFGIYLNYVKKFQCSNNFQSIITVSTGHEFKFMNRKIGEKMMEVSSEKIEKSETEKKTSPGNLQEIQKLIWSID